MRFFMNKLFLALTVALLPINFVLGADVPVYKDGLLTIPSVSTVNSGVSLAEQVGKYQDVTFKLTEQGLWQLQSAKGISEFTGTSNLRLAGVDKADVVKTDTFPVQIFLRISGAVFACSSINQINQRLENNQFYITLASQFDLDPAKNPCVASMVLFQRTISLPVYGLSAGIYSFDVNGINGTKDSKGTFELTADNKYPGDYFGYN